MTTIEYTEYGAPGYDYFRTLISDLGLKSEFEDVWGESLEEFELEISEVEVIREVLDEAASEFLLITNERQPTYRVLQLEGESNGTPPQEDAIEQVINNSNSAEELLNSINELIEQAHTYSDIRQPDETLAEAENAILEAYPETAQG